MSGLAASPIGFLIGLLMGAFGGGGSLLAIPILVYLVDQEPRAAQATALVIVITASITGAITHLRRGDVRWRAGIVFGLAAGISALGGSLVSKELDEDLLLLIFTPVMLAGAWAVVSEQARQPSDFQPWRLGVTPRRVIGTALLGLVVGWMIGLFGVGGGFVIVPVLVLVLHFGFAEAIGTSLLIITIGASFALTERVASGDVDWGIAVPFSVAAIAGAVAGQALSDRLEGEPLRRAFALLVVVAALYTGVQSVGSL